MTRLLDFLLNLAWLASCLPATLAFLAALWWPARSQRRLLRHMLLQWAATRYGREASAGMAIRSAEDFFTHPLTDYESLRPFVCAIQTGELRVLTAEPVIVLQPTSGTGAAPKLIPFTRGLQRQYQAALTPWMATLFMLRPGLLLGRQYWCVSPNTRPIPAQASAVPVGFADDTEYLGAWQRVFARRLFVAPAELARVQDPEAFEFLTLVFLVREANLRLISVWHPSFLTLLLDALPRHAAALCECIRSGELPAGLELPEALRASLARHMRPNPWRAAETARIATGNAAEIRRLWPYLQVISCWTGRGAEPWVDQLMERFPGVAIQGKGLMATEGVVTIPWGFRGRFVCAVRSHFLEFLEPASGHVKRCWELEAGEARSVVLTTAAGLWRYRLGDRVKVTGRVGRTPSLEFLGREGIVSDLCGEKLTPADAEAALDEAAAATGVRFGFAMLVPTCWQKTLGYTLLVQHGPTDPAVDPRACGRVIDEALQRNYHYRHARRLGQLRPAEVRVIRGDADRQYRARLLQLGVRHGDVKYPALRTETDWPAAFELDDYASDA